MLKSSSTTVGADVPDVPDELRCPISCELFRDPVLAADGFKSLGAKPN